MLQKYGDYYDGTEILPSDESDEECLSEKDLLERMFTWTFQTNKCGTCNYFWIFTHFHPSIDCMIEDNVCNIAYPCFPDQDRNELGQQIRSDLDVAIEHFTPLYSKLPEYFDFNEVCIVCIDTETNDKLMEYKMEWNEKKGSLETVQESYSDTDIKKGMISAK